MKCFSVGLTVCFSLVAVSLATPPFADKEEKKAIQECNATNPVQRNIRDVIDLGIGNGEIIHISQEEKCHFHCFLQKVGFFDENGNIKGQELVNSTVLSTPKLVQYSDVVIAQVFQMKRSTNGIEDKCHKAFVAYHQFAQGIFQLIIAESLQHYTGVKDKIINSIKTGQPVGQEISQEVKQFLQFVDALMSAQVNAVREVENKGQTQVSNAQSQASNVQAQAANAQS